MRYIPATQDKLTAAKESAGVTALMVRPVTAVAYNDPGPRQPDPQMEEDVSLTELKVTRQ